MLEGEFPAISPDVLARFVPAKPGELALELGMGIGGMAIELARRGFQVEGIDLSPVAIARLMERVREAGFADRITAQALDLRDFVFPNRPYSVVVANSLLHFFHYEEVVLLCGRIQDSVPQGGLVYASVLSTVDSRYEQYWKTNLPSHGEYTLFGQHNSHFFTEAELPQCFDQLETLICRPWEGNAIEYLGRRR